MNRPAYSPRKVAAAAVAVAEDAPRLAMTVGGSTKKYDVLTNT
jgi:hypothetical protein